MLHAIRSHGRLVSALSALAVIVLATSTPAANPLKQAAKQNTKRMSQSASNEQLHLALQTLQNVHHTLKNADHDYGGHREKAAHSVHAAERQLRTALEHGHKGGKKANNTGGKQKPATTTTGHTHEPQVLSNVQLAQAAAVLENTIGMLSNADHDYGGHRHKAIKDLQIAIGDLGKALAYINNKKQS